MHSFKNLVIISIVLNGFNYNECSNQYDSPKLPDYSKEVVNHKFIECDALGSKEVISATRCGDVRWLPVMFPKDHSHPATSESICCAFMDTICAEIKTMKDYCIIKPSFDVFVKNASDAVKDRCHKENVQPSKLQCQTLLNSLTNEECGKKFWCDSDRELFRELVGNSSNSLKMINIFSIVFSILIIKSIEFF